MLVKKIDSTLVKNGYEEREIKYAFHDVDGTHSLIRNWQPVMSVVLYDVIKNGLPDGYADEKNVKRLSDLCGKIDTPETDKFCIESAGLSGLTQMEWAIRRAVEEGTIRIKCNKSLNSYKIRKIWLGEEIFNEDDGEDLREYISINTPKLFRLYEKTLNLFCRDKNLAEARKHPEKFIVKGSLEFMRFLSANGIKNYFVTGAVVEMGKGMAEEVETLGFMSGNLVETLIGSSWDEKLPKNCIMERLRKKLGAKGEEILVVGDGRSEISAGVKMGAFTVGRADESALRQRKIMEDLGVNVIIENYTDKDFYRIFE